MGEIPPWEKIGFEEIVDIPLQKLHLAILWLFESTNAVLKTQKALEQLSDAAAHPMN